ncbi:hypothetical protein EJ04DRAFT_438134 [Polyplosphaeria fusca]|uniref:Glycosyl transferase n=1 Tax=Polyplosphaeria fusca TaxID=682080 RepID=A0A9P4QYP9_9PLEO|nr:hypothetical protein EJ04DRAFT_438134 [Polyplosphaeria fusca]
MPLGTERIRSSPRIGLYIRIAIAVVILLTVVVVLHPLAAAQEVYAKYQSSPIPSIVHYVYIKRDANSVIDFPFAYFLTLYASAMYLKPEKIYIHTDYNETEIANANKTGSIWTKKVMSTFPDLIEWNQVFVPQWAGANENMKIDAIQHKSDFIRWNEIAKTGGIYMDFDVVPLKSLDPLLNAGFDFVGGRQYGGKDEGGQINGTINNGAFLTKANSAMARIIVREQTMGFDGRWESNLQFMTQVAERLVSIPNQVLILDRQAFAPTHWFEDSKSALFNPNEGRPSPEPLRTNSTDPLDIYDTMIRTRLARQEWEMDFSSTYMLHAFGQGQNNHNITPKKILSRTSNYGIATWEIVKKMLSEGLVTGNEDGDEKKSGGH